MRARGLRAGNSARFSMVAFGVPNVASTVARCCEMVKLVAAARHLSAFMTSFLMAQKRGSDLFILPSEHPRAEGTLPVREKLVRSSVQLASRRALKPADRAKILQLLIYHLLRVDAGSAASDTCSSPQHCSVLASS